MVRLQEQTKMREMMLKRGCLTKIRKGKGRKERRKNERRKQKRMLRVGRTLRNTPR